MRTNDGNNSCRKIYYSIFQNSGKIEIILLLLLLMMVMLTMANKAPEVVIFLLLRRHTETGFSLAKATQHFYESPGVVDVPF